VRMSAGVALVRDILGSRMSGESGQSKSEGETKDELETT
jgi:hypothetical protein